MTKKQRAGKLAQACCRLKPLEERPERMRECTLYWSVIAHVLPGHGYQPLTTYNLNTRLDHFIRAVCLGVRGLGHCQYSDLHALWQMGPSGDQGGQAHRKWDQLLRHQLRAIPNVGFFQGFLADTD